MKRLLIFALFILYSCSDSPTGSGGTTELLSIYDYNYLDNQYFFVDSWYRERFEARYTYDLQHLIYYPDAEIVELEVWISTNRTNENAVEGAAVLDPTDPKWDAYNNYIDIPNEDGQAEHGVFRVLDYSLFSFDPYRGYFWLTKSVANDQALAITYKLYNGQQIGTVDFAKELLLKLIKPKRQTPSVEYEATWPLVMRNVYSFGDTVALLDDYDIEIRNRRTESEKDSTGTSYLNLTGLDIVDESGTLVGKGDGNFDFNPYFFDKTTGILIFPGLYPFDPLEGSRFPLREEDRVDMYNTTNKTQILAERKFQISLVDEN